MTITDREDSTPSTGTPLTGADTAVQACLPDGRSCEGGKTRYHHGDLRAALLAAAERVLVREGIQGLTLRATAREAGVSHAAPKNHFEDICCLLSELAAVGFSRLGAAMEAAAAAAAAPEPGSRKGALGAAYVTFARANPGLFLLMFRSERLDFSRPSLCCAADAALAGLSARVGAPAPSAPSSRLSLGQAADVTAAWALVHGLSLLLIDGRLKPILDNLPTGVGEADLIAAIFGDPPPGARAAAMPPEALRRKRGGKKGDGG